MLYSMGWALYRYLLQLVRFQLCRSYSNYVCMHCRGTVVAMTVGYTGSAFKGYKTLEDAYAGWLNGPSHTPPRWPPLARDAITTHPELYAVTENKTPLLKDTPARSSSGSQPSSPPSSPASLASTATFVSARSMPPPECSKFARTAMPRDTLDNGTTLSPPACPVHQASRLPSHLGAASTRPSSSHSRAKHPASSPSHLIDTARTSTSSIASTTTSSIVVSEGRAYAVTVGDVTGVYLDK